MVHGRHRCPVAGGEAQSQGLLGMPALLETDRCADVEGALSAGRRRWAILLFLATVRRP